MGSMGCSEVKKLRDGTNVLQHGTQQSQGTMRWDAVKSRYYELGCMGCREERCYGMERMERSEAKVPRDGTQRSQGPAEWDAWDATRNCTIVEDAQDAGNADAKAFVLGR